MKTSALLAHKRVPINLIRILKYQNAQEQLAKAKDVSYFIE